jgi:pimeloyl-ACP methyl ester carboxylesterase
VIDENNIPTPKIYQQKNSLHNRVQRASAVIDYLDDAYNFKKVIVYGHSEGAPVAAKLATQNKSITHLGFWAGNVLPDFFDFALEIRKEYYRGTITAKKAQKQIDETLEGFTQHIATDTANVDMEGYTNLRWWSYAEPPLYNLLKLDIPVYVQVATEDESAPIESSYMIPLEFARLKKNNLTYKVCVGCNHSFNIPLKKGKVERKWNEIFANFIQWTEDH